MSLKLLSTVILKVVLTMSLCEIASVFVYRVHLLHQCPPLRRAAYLSTRAISAVPSGAVSTIRRQTEWIPTSADCIDPLSHVVRVGVVEGLVRTTNPQQIEPAIELEH